MSTAPPPTTITNCPSSHQAECGNYYPPSASILASFLVWVFVLRRSPAHGSGKDCAVLDGDRSVAERALHSRLAVGGCGRRRVRVGRARQREAERLERGSCPLEEFRRIAPASSLRCSMSPGGYA